MSARDVVWCKRSDYPDQTTPFPPLTSVNCHWRWRVMVVVVVVVRRNDDPLVRQNRNDNLKTKTLERKFENKNLKMKT